MFHLPFCSRNESFGPDKRLKIFLEMISEGPCVSLLFYNLITSSDDLGMRHQVQLSFLNEPCKFGREGSRE